MMILEGKRHEKMWISLCIVSYVFITFFGLGPVLLADGTTTERFITFLIVLLLYGVVTFVLIFILKKR